MQTDPIGRQSGQYLDRYLDGMNLYAYVGNDPVNFFDQTGLSHEPVQPPELGGLDPNVPCVGPCDATVEVITPGVIQVTGKRPKPRNPRWSRTRPNAVSWYMTTPEFVRPVQGRVKPVGPQIEREACADALLEEGAVVTDQLNGTLIVGGGIAGSWGSFRNLRTGTTGSFFTLGGGAGVQGGLDATSAFYGRLSQLNGGAVSFSGGLGPFSGGLNTSVSADGIEFSGGELGGGFGQGASLTFTGTKIYGCRLGGGN